MCETNILYYLCGCYVKDVRRYGCGPYLRTQDPHCEYMDRYEDRRMEECYDCGMETKRILEMREVGKEGREQEGTGGSEEGSEDESSNDEGSKNEDPEDDGSEQEASEDDSSKKEVKVEDGKEEEEEVIEEKPQKEGSTEESDGLLPT